MSLMGSLDDLGLGDILQIVHLAQKSGVLIVRAEGAEGRVMFEQGLVRLARLKGDPEDLRGLLVDRGLVACSDFDAAAALARATGEDLSQALSRLAPIDLERIDGLRRELVETAVGEMFSWERGEFSFDAGAEAEYRDSELLLSVGVNAQYLAMESLRVRDEKAMRDRRGSRAPGAGAAAAETPPAETPELDFELIAESLPELEPEPQQTTCAENLPPVIVIDAQLSVLEWVRDCLAETCASVHIFQRSQQGLGRIRQYLARAQAPVLLVSPKIEGNPMSGIVDAADFVRRLRGQAPRMPIFWLVVEGELDAAALPLALPTVVVPGLDVLEAAGRPDAPQGLAREISASLLEQMRRHTGLALERVAGARALAEVDESS